MASVGSYGRPTRGKKLTLDELDHLTGTLDILSSFASHSKASLNELSKVMGLPGTPKGIDGTDVERYFLEGKVKEIAEYCETDVINSYQVWLRYELFRGTLSQDMFQASEQNLAKFVDARVRPSRVVFKR